MYQPTLAELKQVLYVLDEPAPKRFVRTVLNDDYVLEGHVSAKQQVQILVHDWLAHLGIFSDAQQYEVVRAFEASWEGMAAWIEHCGNRTEKPTFTLAICDYRWVSCNLEADEGFYDVQESDRVPEMPAQAVTHVICNLTALWMRNYYRLAHIRSVQGGTHDRPDGEGSGQPAVGEGQQAQLAPSGAAGGGPGPAAE